MEKQQVSNKANEKKIGIGILSFLISMVVWGSITLSEQYYTSLEVPIKVINVPKNFSFDGDIPNKLLIKIRVQGWRLLLLKNFEDELFIVSLPKDNQNTRINFRNLIADNPWLAKEGDIISISPEEAYLHIAQSVKKRVPVISSIELSFKDGYGLASPLIIDPDTISITGTKSALDKIEFVTTEETQIKFVNEPISSRVYLSKQQGIYFSSDMVQVRADVQKLVDKEFANIPIEIINISPGQKIECTPDKITINVKGGLDILGKLHQKDFRATIDYREVVKDSLGIIVPNIILPASVEKKYIEPSKVRVVIKK